MSNIQAAIEAQKKETEAAIQTAIKAQETTQEEDKAIL